MTVNLGCPKSDLCGLLPQQDGWWPKSASCLPRPGVRNFDNCMYLAGGALHVVGR